MPNDPRQGLVSAGTPVRLPNVQSFASLFRREYPRLVGMAWGLTGSREAEEDVVQDVMLTVYTQWEDLPAMSSP